jgi:erythronate-4-phosphate dehydrogenase
LTHARPSTPRIVADQAIGWVHEAFGDFGELRAMPGHTIDREALRDADVVLTRSVTSVDATLLAGSRIRFVGSCTAGIDHVDLEFLRGRGIAFAHAPGCNARAVAEYVITGLHAAWAQTPRGTPLGPVAVIGFGQIGRHVTRLLRALGHRVRVSDPPLAERIASGTAELDPQLATEPLMSLEDAVRGARVVTVHVPLQPDGPHPTVHLIDESRLALLPWGALVVNTSRGSIVDDAALEAWARSSGGRAILDAWEGEPNLRWSLLDGSPSPVRLGTPHIAGYTREGKARATAMVHDALATWLGRAPAFDATRVLGPPQSEPLVPAAPGVLPDLAARDGRSTLARCLLAAHPLHLDDLRLRQVAQRSPNERGPAFETLRRTYCLRRELAHLHILAGELSSAPDVGLPHDVATSLAALDLAIHP